jgi:hypothetical protein
VAELVEQSVANLAANFFVVGAHGFDVLLVEVNPVGRCGVEGGLLGEWDAVE